MREIQTPSATKLSVFLSWLQILCWCHHDDWLKAVVNINQAQALQTLELLSSTIIRYLASREWLELDTERGLRMQIFTNWEWLYIWKLAGSLSQLRLCVVVWVWGSVRGRDCGGQESDTVSVSCQPQMRAQYRCTVHSTQYTAWYRERSKLEPREKFTLAQLWQKYINTVKLFLSRVWYKVRKFVDEEMFCVLWAVYENQICVSSALPAPIQKNISEFSHA